MDTATIVPALEDTSHEGPTPMQSVAEEQVARSTRNTLTEGERAQWERIKSLGHLPVFTG